MTQSLNFDYNLSFVTSVFKCLLVAYGFGFLLSYESLSFFKCIGHFILLMNCLIIILKKNCLNIFKTSVPGTESFTNYSVGQFALSVVKKNSRSSVYFQIPESDSPVHACVYL